MQKRYDTLAVEEKVKGAPQEEKGVEEQPGKEKSDKAKTQPKEEKIGQVKGEPWEEKSPDHKPSLKKRRAGKVKSTGRVAWAKVVWTKGPFERLRRWLRSRQQYVLAPSPRCACQGEQGAEIVQLIFCLPLVMAMLAGCIQVAYQQLSASTLSSEIDYAASAVEPAVLASYGGDETKEAAYVKSVLTSKILTLTNLESLEISDVTVQYATGATSEGDLDPNDERNVINDPMGDYVLQEFDKSISRARVSFKVTYTIPQFFPTPVGNPTLTRTVVRDHTISSRTEVM